MSNYLRHGTLICCSCSQPFGCPRQWPNRPKQRRGRMLPKRSVRAMYPYWRGRAVSAGSWTKTGKPRELPTLCRVFQKDILVSRIGVEEEYGFSFGFDYNALFQAASDSLEEDKAAGGVFRAMVNGSLSEKTRKIQEHSYIRWKTATALEPTSLPKDWEAKSGTLD